MLYTLPFLSFPTPILTNKFFIASFQNGIPIHFSSLSRVTTTLLISLTFITSGIETLSFSLSGSFSLVFSFVGVSLVAFS